MKNIYPLLLLFYVICLSCCANKTVTQENPTDENLTRAEQTLEALYKNYAVPGSNLLRETFPFDDAHQATYLASDEATNILNQYSYLWPFSGTFSAVNALLETTGDQKYREILDKNVLTGLEEYFDTQREPPAYSSYINGAPISDRFYDDNVWLGIDFTDTYRMTGDAKYLDKAKLIWQFIESGTDDLLGGGIYWCEQRKESKNTCSNAPGAVYALKLFMATSDSTYFQKGKDLYNWTKENLQDSEDKLFFDNIRLDGSVDKRKYAYNSGQMLQAAVLLHKLTEEKGYLDEANEIAASCAKHFFTDHTNSDGQSFKLIKNGDIWFTAVMLRGFTELYSVDTNPFYIDLFKTSLEYSWHHMRDENGLYNTDWSGQKKDDKKWLLTQAAFVEMQARLAAIK